MLFMRDKIGDVFKWWIFMGLFGNKSDDDKLIEAYNRISSSGVVNCKIYVGRHGADEIVAGAMMGNTGKLIAMNNYGKAKFEHSVLELHINGIAFNFAMMYDVFCELFVDSLKNHIKEVSLNVL